MKNTITIIASIIFSISIITTKAGIPTYNLMLKYFFDDQTANDGSGNGNNGILHNTTTTTDRFGNANQALHFNGTNAYVSLTDAILNNQYITISFWFKTSLSAQGAMLGHQNNVVSSNPSQYVPVVYQRSDQYLHGGMYTGDATTCNTVNSTVNYSDYQWHHLVLTADATSQHIYIDNVAIGTNSNGYQVLTGMLKGQFGAAYFNSYWPYYPATGWQFFNGDMDDLAIYHRQLSVAEINQLFTDTYSTCNINIPDANFKAYLVGNSAINTNNDTEIQCSEASAFTGSINCNNISIADMTGIENFTALTSLSCGGNTNTFTSLDVTQLVNLTSLNTDYIQFTSLDVTQNIALTNLYISNGLLTSIDITNNTALEIVNLYSNNLTSLDASQNIALIQLSIDENAITSVDVSNSSSLEVLNCNDNMLTNLDVFQNTSLHTLRCYNNSITSLNLSNNTLLTLAYSYANSLTSLNVANGNNTNLDFYTANNPNLSCITVDNQSWSNTNWTASNGNIDATHSFSTSCLDILSTALTIQGQGGLETITTQGGTLQMEATVLPLNATNGTVSWYVNNANATIDANGLLTAAANGTVEVSAVTNDASQIIATKTITITNQSGGGSVAINNLRFETLKVFPNPSTGLVNIDVNEELSSIILFDYTGKSIKEFNATSKQLDVSDINAGIYFLAVANAEKKSIIKLIVR